MDWVGGVWGWGGVGEAGGGGGIPSLVNLTVL